MIQLGTALKSQEPPFHRCLVLSDPQASGGQVVLVRLTTDDGTWPDRDCVLTPADWNELEHNSTVAYSTCKFGPAVSSLEARIISTDFIPFGCGAAQGDCSRSRSRGNAARCKKVAGANPVIPQFLRLRRLTDL